MDKYEYIVMADRLIEKMADWYQRGHEASSIEDDNTSEADAKIAKFKSWAIYQ